MRDLQTPHGPEADWVASPADASASRRHKPLDCHRVRRSCGLRRKSKCVPVPVFHAVLLPMCPFPSPRFCCAQCETRQGPTRRISRLAIPEVARSRWWPPLHWRLQRQHPLCDLRERSFRRPRAVTLTRSRPRHSSRQCTASWGTLSRCRFLPRLRGPVARRPPRPQLHSLSPRLRSRGSHSASEVSPRGERGVAWRGVVPGTRHPLSLRWHVILPARRG
jgi:hypothetical protein